MKGLAKGREGQEKRGAARWHNKKKKQHPKQGVGRGIVGVFYKKFQKRAGKKEMDWGARLGKNWGPRKGGEEGCGSGGDPRKKERGEWMGDQKKKTATVGGAG